MEKFSENETKKRHLSFTSHVLESIELQVCEREKDRVHRKRKIYKCGLYSDKVDYEPKKQ